MVYIYTENYLVPTAAITMHHNTAITYSVKYTDGKKIEMCCILLQDQQRTYSCNVA